MNRYSDYNQVSSFSVQGTSVVYFPINLLSTLCCTAKEFLGNFLVLKKLLKFTQLKFKEQSTLTFSVFTNCVHFFLGEIVFEGFPAHCVALAFCNSRSFSRPCEIKAFVRSTHAESRIHSIKVYCALKQCALTQPAGAKLSSGDLKAYHLWVHILGFAI